MPDTAKTTRPSGNRPGSTKVSPAQRSKDRAEARRRELAAKQQRESRNRLLMKILIPVAVVIVVVVVFVVVKVTGGTSDDTPVASGAASNSVVTGVTTVPAATLNSIGAGSASSGTIRPVDMSPLTADGKPRVVYYGGEFCPFCAAERWSVVAALARFGTWSNLGQTTSAGSPEVFPNTSTLSFHGASYTSQYLSFTGYELTDRDHQTLDTPTSDDNALITKYDAAPYVSANQAGSIPFVLYGGQYLSNGSAYDPSLLENMSHDEIADALKNPVSDVAKGVDGGANVITAALCKLTNGQPGDVCSSSGVQAAASKLGS